MYVLIFFEVVEGDIESGHRGPEGAWKGREGMEEMVVNDLVDKLQRIIANDCWTDAGEEKESECSEDRTVSGRHIVSGSDSKHEKALYGEREGSMRMRYKKHY